MLYVSTCMGSLTIFWQKEEILIAVIREGDCTCIFIVHVHCAGYVHVQCTCASVQFTCTCMMYLHFNAQLYNMYSRQCNLLKYSYKYCTFYRTCTVYVASNMSTVHVHLQCTFVYVHVPCTRSLQSSMFCG